MQADLESGSALPLRRLLDASALSFLATHDEASTERNYLYAWGVAFYLMFQGDVLDGERVERYVDPSGDEDAVARFERFVGLPLDRFETQWREAMLTIRPPR